MMECLMNPLIVFFVAYMVSLIFAIGMLVNIWRRTK